jgi:hypothetical protein
MAKFIAGLMLGTSRLRPGPQVFSGPARLIGLPDDGAERDSRADPPQSHAGDPDNARGMRCLDARAVG